MAVAMATGSQCLLSLENKTKLSGGGGEGKEPGQSWLGLTGGNHAGATLFPALPWWPWGDGKK